jgi:hypothetical protein
MLGVTDQDVVLPCEHDRGQSVQERLVYWYVGASIEIIGLTGLAWDVAAWETLNLKLSDQLNFATTRLLPVVILSMIYF